MDEIDPLRIAFHQRVMHVLNQDTLTHKINYHRLSMALDIFEEISKQPIDFSNLTNQILVIFRALPDLEADGKRNIKEVAQLVGHLIINRYHDRISSRIHCPKITAEVE